MEEKKLKEIEAKLRQLLLHADQSKTPETSPSLKKFYGSGVIRRRKGHKDLHIN